MRSETKDENNLLDSAARVFRDRLSSGSRFQALLDSSTRDAAAGALDNGETNLPYTLRLSRGVESAASQIGDMPPQPPTMRGRIGAVLVQAVRRSLFWYTGQIRAFQGMVAEAAREQVTAIQELAARQQRQQALFTDVLRRQSELEQEREQNLRDQEGWRDEFHRKLTTIEKTLAARQAQIDEALARMETQGREVRQQMHRERTHLIQQEFRLKMLRREVRKSPSAERRADATRDVAEQMMQVNDALFVDHAKAFRGDRAEIKSRLAVYTPYVQEAFAATAGAPALDLGCGRGEWLELLRKMEIPASGVDWNHDLVQACCEMGLDARQGDIPRVLDTIPDESLSLVTAFHVLEHVPFQDLLEVIDHAVRMLKPGGIAIFETPNPRNIFVSSNNFYLDPTHRHPIPSEFLAFVVEARGLCHPKVMPLSPYPDHFRLSGSACPAVQFINDHFYGPQDYGIVGFKA